MAININELSLTVKGNIVKNNDSNGDSVLRMTQEQAQEIYGDLGDFLSRHETREKASVTEIPASSIVGSVGSVKG